MKLISIGFGRDIFQKNTDAYKRAEDQAGLFEELHIIVFSLKSHSMPEKIQIAPNAWIYGTNSHNRLVHIFSAIKIGKEILVNSKKSKEGIGEDSWIVTAQDPFESGMAAYMLSKKTKMKLHLQVHTDLFSPYYKKHSLSNRFRLWLAQFLLPKADGIRVVSTKIKNSLLALKLKTTPFVLPVFIDVSNLKNYPFSVDLRKSYPQFKFIILVAGRLSKEKNIFLALNTMKEVIKKHPEAGMVIVGSGSEEAKLKGFASRLGLDKNVVFKTWTWDLLSYYKTADLFLQCSFYEGNSRAILEAAFSHLPIVSTDTGIAGEILEGKFSSVCPVGDEECLKQKISYLIEHEEVRKEIAENALKKLQETVYVEKEKYLKEYRRSFQTV